MIVSKLTFGEKEFDFSDKSYELSSSAKSSSSIRIQEEERKYSLEHHSEQN
jgi:hypothetical protein